MSEVSASDADSSASNNNVVEFSLSSTVFGVGTSSGVVSLVQSLDRETIDAYVKNEFFVSTAFRFRCIYIIYMRLVFYKIYIFFGFCC